MLRRKLKARDFDDDDANSANAFLERRRALSKRISYLHDVQHLYTPGSEPVEIDPVLLADHPENIKLWLPSALPPTSCDTQSIKDLRKLEYRLRYAQAMDALHNIRSHSRLVRAYMTKTQSHISDSQGTVTRTQRLFDRVKSKRAQAVSTYRIVQRAIANLAPNEEFGPWKEVLQELKDSDVRGPGHEGLGSTKARFVPSWIWTATSKLSTSPDDPGLQAALRVEWCKAQERAKRYEEEVELVAEEMRQTLVTLEWNAKEWETLAATPPPPTHGSNFDISTMVGMAAYAYKQAEIQRRMVTTFVNEWRKTLNDHSPSSSWLEGYPSSPDDKRRRLISNVRLYHPASYDPSTDTTNESISMSPDGAEAFYQDSVLDD